MARRMGQGQPIKRTNRIKKVGTKPSRGANLPQQAKGVGFAVGRTSRPAAASVPGGIARGGTARSGPAVGGFSNLKPGGLVSGGTSRTGATRPTSTGTGAFTGLKPGGIPIGSTGTRAQPSALTPRPAASRKTGIAPKRRI